MNKKGLSLLELMVVVLLIGILAAVAVPGLVKGQVDAAKWTEAKTAMGTIATALRAYCVEQATDVTKVPEMSSVVIDTNDLHGTYFHPGDYGILSVSFTRSTGALTYTIQASKVGMVPYRMTLNQAGVWEN